MKKIVIIGGSDAGISVALRAREIDPGLTPTMVVADEYPNFSICGLPYYISRDVADWKDLAHRTREEIEQAGIRLLTSHTARSIDPTLKKVSITDRSGTQLSLDYDRLVLATGAESVRPIIPGIDNPGVFFLRWLPDSFAIDGFITRHNPESALIIGGGFIGMEMSEALKKRGLAVTVVEYSETIMPSFSPGTGMKIKDALAANGVSVRNSVAIESIDLQNRKLTVTGTNGFHTAADMVLVSVGASPGTVLGQSIGIETGARGAYRVNRKMETSIPDIYAAGDCAETYHGIIRKNVYMPLGTVAHKQGRIAGENAAGGSRKFAGYFGTQSVKIFDRVIAKTGLNDREAKEAGFDPASADFETWDHKAYYPPADTLYIRVTADRPSQKILGAEMLGAYKTEVSKRIDILAAAIFHGMTVREFSDYDLSYTPPLSSPWDPVQMAVQKLESLL